MSYNKGVGMNPVNPINQVLTDIEDIFGNQLKCLDQLAQAGQRLAGDGIAPENPPEPMRDAPVTMRIARIRDIATVIRGRLESVTMQIDNAV